MNFYTQVYAVVRKIPAGHVTSYGRIARMLGRPRASRAVGYALNALKDMNDSSPADKTRKNEEQGEVPWWRVINAQGRISTINRELSASKQADYLRSEGIPVNDELKIDLDRYLWEGLSFIEAEEIMGMGNSG